MDSISLITFCLGNQLLAIPIDQVREVIRNVPVSSVASWTGLLHGIINVRGIVMPVLDLRTLLGEANPTNTSKTRIIIVDMLGKLAGLIVDQVHDIISLKQNQMVPRSVISMGKESAILVAVAKIEEQLYLVIDVQQLVHEEERNLFCDICLRLKREGENPTAKEKAKSLLLTNIDRPEQQSSQ